MICCSFPSRPGGFVSFGSDLFGTKRQYHLSPFGTNAKLSSVSVGALSKNGTLTLKYQAKTAVGTTIAWRLVLLHTHSAMLAPGLR